MQIEASSITPVSVFSSDIKDENEIPFINKDWSLVEQRSNIYDNDEFDLFNRDNVDLTRIHRGKKFVHTFYIMIFMISFSEHETPYQFLMTNLIWKEWMNVILV